MPLKDPIKLKEYLKEYYRKNKEKIAEKKRKERGNLTKEQQEKKQQYNKDYYNNNKSKILERVLEQQKSYNKTENGRKKALKCAWFKGSNPLICDDLEFEEIWKRYWNASHCEVCEIEFAPRGKNNSFKCMDHDHKTGKFRNVVCVKCNNMRGREDNPNAWDHLKKDEKEKAKYNRTEEQIQKMKEYQRKYHKEHDDKEKERARQKKLYEKNKEKKKAKMKEYRDNRTEEQIEKMKEYQREYRAKKKR